MSGPGSSSRHCLPFIHFVRPNGTPRFVNQLLFSNLIGPSFIGMGGLRLEYKNMAFVRIGSVE